tara:strand:- start:66 stop:179 length:114 start_codon:yes stop_codon:yes gene_type:complete
MLNKKHKIQMQINIDSLENKKPTYPEGQVGNTSGMDL